MAKFRNLMLMIKRFLSNRANLSIIQCLLYFIIGYVMGQYLNWMQLVIMYIVLFGIQFITRTKAIADGIMFNHLMERNNMEANEFLEYIRRQQDDINKRDLN